MIQMKSGVYGTKNMMRGASYGPFSLSEAEEERLVQRGVAVYVNPRPVLDDDFYYAKVSDGAPIGLDETLDKLPDGVEGIPEYSVDSSLSDLRAIGKMCGLTFKVGMSKADIVAALDKHIEENSVDGYDIEDDGEDAPDFNAADSVVD